LGPIEKVLLVDDQVLPLKSVARDFARQGVTPFIAETGPEALATVGAEQPDLAIIDLFLTPPENGLELIKDLKRAKPDLFCILVSAHMTVAHAMMGVRAGADDVFLKPFTADQVLHRANGGAPVAAVEIPTLEQIEWEHIARVLGDYDGNITHAAEALGIWRQSLQRKIHKHAPRVLVADEPAQTTRAPRRRPPTE
jgi:two-component system response regulator RegA